MNDFAKGALAGAGLVLLIAVLVRQEMMMNERQAAATPTVSVTAIGPDGSADKLYGENLDKVEVPGSETYPLCLVTEMKVQRPSMMTSDMPDSYCRLTPGGGGKWLLSTGGWQECGVSCFRLAESD